MRHLETPSKGLSEPDPLHSTARNAKSVVHSKAATSLLRVNGSQPILQFQKR
jgi:hypothetical protein